MPLTQLDPRPALLAVDVQKGTLAMSDPQEAERVVTQTAFLAHAFHAAGLPVIWVRALGLPPVRTDRPLPPAKTPGDFADLDPRLPVQDGDFQAHKRATSALTMPELGDFLRTQGVTQLVVTGLATGMGVESTVRAAFDAGFHVVVAADAVTDPWTERGQNSLNLTLPGFAEVSAVDDILSALEARNDAPSAL